MILWTIYRKENMTKKDKDKFIDLLNTFGHLEVLDTATEETSEIRTPTYAFFDFAMLPDILEAEGFSDTSVSYKLLLAEMSTSRFLNQLIDQGENSLSIGRMGPKLYLITIRDESGEFVDNIQNLVLRKCVRKCLCDEMP